MSAAVGPDSPGRAPGEAQPPSAASASPPPWAAPGTADAPGGDPWGGGAPPGWAPAAASPAPVTGNPRTGPGWGELAGPPEPVYGAVVLRPGIVPIKPLGLGDILEGAFRAIRHNPRVMIGMTLVVGLLVGVISAVPAVATLGASLPVLDDTEVSGEALIASVTASAGGLLLSSFLFTLGVSIVAGLLTLSVSQSVLDRRITLGQAWERLRRRIWPLLGQAVLIGVGTLLPGLAAIGIAVLIGTTAGVVPGLLTGSVLLLASFVVTTYLTVVWCMGPAALVLEGLGPLRGLRRSMRLVHRAFWRTLGILVLTSLLTGVVTSIVATPAQIVAAIVLAAFPDSPVGFVVYTVLIAGGSVLANLLAYPYVAGITTLLYVDRRIRTEGLDAALLTAVTPR